jgi:hypothetical protein
MQNATADADRLLAKIAVATDKHDTIQALGKSVDAIQMDDSIADKIITNGINKKVADLSTALTEKEAAMPTITSTKPWLAHKAASATGGKFYESQAVTERTWSDGTVDYACSLDGCDYTSDKPHSVRAHYGRSVSHPNLGTRKDAKEVKGKDYFEAMTHRPTKGRIEAILAVLAKHPEAGHDLPLPDLIELILSADMERDPLYERGENLITGLIGGQASDADIVEHFRRVLGIGNKEAELTEALAAANADLDKALAEVERLKNERTALRELLTEEGS